MSDRRQEIAKALNIFLTMRARNTFFSNTNVHFTLSVYCREIYTSYRLSTHDLLYPV